ncbi:MAG: hypothetical protein ACE5J5_00375 [Candidatus Hydrothermarchaeales archaeon]
MVVLKALATPCSRLSEGLGLKDNFVKSEIDKAVGKVIEFG